MMDNGNFRIFPAAVTCGTGSAPPCLYSTIPIMQINESTMTATLTFHQVLPTPLYNDFGGNAETLANGNVEYDLCGLGAESSQVFEVTDQSQSANGLESDSWRRIGPTGPIDSPVSIPECNGRLSHSTDGKETSYAFLPVKFFSHARYRKDFSATQRISFNAFASVCCSLRTTMCQYSLVATSGRR